MVSVSEFRVSRLRTGDELATQFGVGFETMTADELLQLPNDGWRYELLQGDLRQMPRSGARHGRGIVGSLIAHMKAPANRRGVFIRTGFRISRQPDTVRAPDAAFVRSERVTDPASFFDGPPDAAFEVVSPGDHLHRDQRENARMASRRHEGRGRRRSPHEDIARAPHGSASNAEDVIAIDDVIPGWRLPLAELFA
jgi:hypothetical protein